jgi:acyl dehydratase
VTEHHQLSPITKDRLTHTQLVKYAGASGDFNPIHTVVPIAKQAGFPDVIAHGMYVMGIAGEAITTWFPRKTLRKFNVRFKRITYPGETLTVQGQLTDNKQVNGETRLVGKIQVVNQEEEIKLEGWFEVEKVEEEATC